MISQLRSTKGRTLSCLVIAAGMSVTSSITYAATAQAYVSQGPFVTPMPGSMIPGSTQVPGKEYSHFADQDSIGNPDSMQVIEWDGAGGVRDGVDFGTENEVDAIANEQDVLLDSVINNTSALLFSVQGDGNIYFNSVTHTAGVWADPLTINNNHMPYDVDGLEVWGSEVQGDANRYSIAGDVTGTAVYDSSGVAMISSADIATAIGLDGVAIDLDALMFNYDKILFSIAPAGPFDGGEVWSWDFVNPAAFLNQGGHVWDTVHDIVGEFGSETENINALEAVSSVPVPAAVWLFGSGLLGLLGVARKKRNH